ncbi:MAG: hypothetical protein QOD52_930 [Gaiellaceae bacterium]|jgi:hypothetical protein|nr:hypothetical protein [Gaiellaceae bacterium]
MVHADTFTASSVSSDLTRGWRLRIVPPPPRIARAFTLAYMEPGPEAVRDLGQRGPLYSAAAGMQPQANGRNS